MTAWYYYNDNFKYYRYLMCQLDGGRVGRDGQGDNTQSPIAWLQPTHRRSTQKWISHNRMKQNVSSVETNLHLPLSARVGLLFPISNSPIHKWSIIFRPEAGRWTLPPMLTRNSRLQIGCVPRNRRHASIIWTNYSLFDNRIYSRRCSSARHVGRPLRTWR